MARCRAWAFSYPATENASAVCWLKSKVTPRVAAPCCVSGVRGAGVIEPRTGAVEFGFDRFGGDYRHFDTAMDASGKSCQLACEAEGGCRAWTYVRPGYIGAAAVCYLKNRITAPGAQTMLHFRCGQVRDRSLGKNLQQLRIPSERRSTAVD